MVAIFNSIPVPGVYEVLINPVVRVEIELTASDILELSKNHYLESREVTVQGYGKEYPGHMWFMVDPKRQENVWPTKV